jgi:RNA polymerase sigma factor (sigma-70 family)
VDVDYEALYRQLLPLARVVAPAGVDGADLVQEALTRALTRHPQLRGVRDPVSYLSTAVVNTARTWGVRAARRAQADRVRDARSVAPQTATEVAAALVSEAEMHDILVRLPPRQRACLYLRFVEDLDVDETARRLGCSAGTVKSQTSKATAALRRALGTAPTSEVDHHG